MQNRTRAVQTPSRNKLHVRLWASIWKLTSTGTVQDSSVLACIAGHFQCTGNLGSPTSLSALVSTDLNALHLQRCPVFSFELYFLMLMLLPSQVQQCCFLLHFLDPRSKVSLLENSRTHWLLWFFAAISSTKQGRSISSFCNGSVQTQELLCLFSTHLRNCINYFGNSTLGLALQIFTWGNSLPIFSPGSPD